MKVKACVRVTYEERQALKQLISDASRERATRSSKLVHDHVTRTDASVRRKQYRLAELKKEGLEPLGDEYVKCLTCEKISRKICPKYYRHNDGCPNRTGKPLPGRTPIIRVKPKKVVVATKPRLTREERLALDREKFNAKYREQEEADGWIITVKGGVEHVTCPDCGYTNVRKSPWRHWANCPSDRIGRRSPIAAIGLDDANGLNAENAA